jgi:hypothetical protein
MTDLKSSINLFLEFIFQHFFVWSQISQRVLIIHDETFTRDEY